MSAPKSARERESNRHGEFARYWKQRTSISPDVPARTVCAPYLYIYSYIEAVNMQLSYTGVCIGT